MAGHGEGKRQKQGRESHHHHQKAFHDYHIEDKLEAGIVLRGTGVKALRTGQVNLRDSDASVDRGEAILPLALAGFGN